MHLSAEALLGPLTPLEQRSAPAEVWARGRLTLASGRARVAIVGARRASPEGQLRARRLAAALAHHGVVVASGLAEGVDRAAHEATMAAKGDTIGVIGTPIDVAYPAAHRGLQERIAREHLLVSQFAPGTSMGRAAFPMRNRLMALLTHATVIVEASETSGSLSQGWEALRLGRPLFLMKSIFDAGLTWPDEMARYGAQVLAEVDDLLEQLPSTCGSLADAPF